MLSPVLLRYFLQPTVNPFFFFPKKLSLRHKFMCYSFIRDCRPREVEVRGEEKEGTQGVRIPWRRKWYPAPVVLPGKHHGQRSLAGCSPWSPKKLYMTQLLRTQSGENKQEYATSWPLLELGMASFVYLPRNHMKLYLSGQPVVGRGILWSECILPKFIC